LVLIVQAADVVDLDPGCVLYGALELTPLDRVEFLGIDMPRATRNLLIVCGLNLVFVVAMFKELKITSFDGDLATTLGISANLMHYLLMAMVAVTTVACFESVGSILVLAMLIVPPATAYLLTDRLHVMVILGVVMAAVSAAFGHLAAITIPPLAGYPSTTTSGMMATIAGLLLVVALLAGPRHGLINNMLHRSKLRFDILREDILALVYRLEESPKQPSQQNVSDLIRRALGIGRISAGYALASLQRRGHLVQENHGYHLTPSGETIARHLIRSHRLWERFLQTELQLPADRLHAPAMELEHVTDASMREALAKTAGQADTDPHGKPIPQEEKAD